MAAAAAPRTWASSPRTLIPVSGTAGTHTLDVAVAVAHDIYGVARCTAAAVPAPGIRSSVARNTLASAVHRSISAVVVRYLAAVPWEGNH